MKRLLLALIFVSLVGCVTQPTPRPSLPTEHVVQPGETVAGIAAHYYGKERMSEGMRAILRTNPQIQEPHPLRVLRLTIPELPRTMEVTILVPADVQKYDEVINGEQDFKGAAELPFVRKKVVVPYSRDVIRASADAAATEMPSQGGATIIYLRIDRGTAYVLLNIDRDGWAGVSFSLARCHPVVEKTLLQFKNVKRVVWNEAPSQE